MFNNCKSSSEERRYLLVGQVSRRSPRAHECTEYRDEEDGYCLDPGEVEDDVCVVVERLLH